MTRFQENLDALDAGMCTAQCILSRDDEVCDCRCQGKHHGLMRQVLTTNGPMEVLINTYGDDGVIGQTVTIPTEYGTHRIALVLQEWDNLQNAQTAAELWKEGIDKHMRQIAPSALLDAYPDRFGSETPEHA